MSFNNSIMNDINLVGQIADLKENNYKNTLVISALIEVLIEKGVFTRKELIKKIEQLDLDLQINTKAN